MKVLAPESLARRGPPGPVLRGLAAACLFGLVLVLVETRWGPLHRVDLAVLAGLHRLALHHPPVVLGMKVVSALGTFPVYAVLVAAAGIVLLRHGRRREAAFVVTTVTGGSVLDTVLKAVVGRPRPALVHPVATAAGASFPSGHANGAAVAVGVLLVLLTPALRRRWQGPATAWAALVGFSRLALGVHYLSDVVAGAALGAAWVIGCTLAWGLAGTRASTARREGRHPHTP